jgi:transposase-like protein
MSLGTISDAFLAAHAAGGDDAAFAELARRYRPLIGYYSSGPPAGIDMDDLRQSALLALFETCSRHDPAKGSFRALAKRNVRGRVNAARVQARTIKHRLLSDATRDGDEPGLWLEARLAAPAGSDPLRAVELRDELREYAERTRKVDRRRRYTDEQAARAVALVAEGKTLKEAAFAVGASRDRVARWVQQAGQSRSAGRRCFTAAEIERAVALVGDGASLREAAATIGASSCSVLRWVRDSGQPRRRRARPFTAAEVERAVTLVRAGATLREAGVAVGASKGTVQRWVRQAA